MGPRRPPPGPQPRAGPGSGPQTPSQSASDLSGPRGCCCRHCCCRSRYCCCCCCCCCRRRPWHSCAGPSRAALGQARGGGRPQCVGDTGPPGPLTAAGAAAGAGRGSSSSACLQHLPPRLRGLSPACRVRAPSPRERRACDPSRGESARLAGPLGHAPSRPSPPPGSPTARRRLSDGFRTNHKGFYEGVEPGHRSPPPADLGLFYHHAAACEREPLSAFQSVLVLWNVANVEAERALASVGAPRTMGLGRGAGAGRADTCAESCLSAPPLGPFLGVLSACHFPMHRIQSLFLRNRCASCRYYY